MQQGFEEQQNQSQQPQQKPEQKKSLWSLKNLKLIGLIVVILLILILDHIPFAVGMLLSQRISLIALTTFAYLCARENQKIKKVVEGKLQEDAIIRERFCFLLMGVFFVFLFFPPTGIFTWTFFAGFVVLYAIEEITRKVERKK